MNGRRSGFWIGLLASALGAALVAAGCGNSSSNPGKPGGGAGNSSAGSSGSDAGSGGAMPSAGSSGAAGSVPCTGTDCAAGGSGNVANDVAATKACRECFDAACARIRECGARTFRPCESPIDACPDILFSAGSSWTVSALEACTAAWPQHSCEALEVDEWPACHQVPGMRAVGEPCVFDSQCQGELCNGGISPHYSARCGSCAEVSPSHGACDSAHVCPVTQVCEEGSCVDGRPIVDQACLTIQCDEDARCEQGECKARLPVDAACAGNDQCVAGLECQIAIVAEPAAEPTMGTCRPLPAIGQPCLPSFGHVGLCGPGGTCDGRPTGNCVPLVAIGETCGFARCVEGAYCQVYGFQSLPSHKCYALGQAGDACPHEGPSLGNLACAEGLDCLCETPGCKTGICQVASQAGDACSATERCSNSLACLAGVCVDPGTETGVTPAGGPCLRFSDFGRESSSCQSGLSCMCTTPACVTSLCATARESGEACDSQTEICQQGLVCTGGTCTEVASRGFDADICSDLL